MLISVRMKNFRSFRDRSDLSLAASNSEKLLQSCLLRPKKSDVFRKDLLPAIAIYGANSAGKTNVLRAIECIQNAVVNSQAKWVPGQGTHIETYFMHKNSDQPAVLEIDFLVEGKKYSYGFAARKSNFVQEWLISFSGTEECVEFERDTASIPSDKQGNVFATQINLGVEFGVDEVYRAGLKGRVRENSLLLSAAAQDNNPLCRRIFDWFSQKFDFENINVSFDRAHAMMTAQILKKEGVMKQEVLALMRVADPTIQDIRVVDNDPVDYSHPLMNSISGELKTFVDQQFAFKIEFITRAGKKLVSMPFDAQSRGFQKLFALAVRINFALVLGNVLVVDEIESSIHPHLARYIVDLFQNKEINVGRGATDMLDSRY